MWNFLIQTAYFDAAQPWQITLQDPATPVMEGIINFHQDLMFFLVVVVIFILSILSRSIFYFSGRENGAAPQNFVHGTVIEIVWTTVPAIVLLIIAIPSFALLYSMDEMVDPLLTLKVIGHQWYWSYEYSDDLPLLEEGLNFESYMIQDDDLYEGSFRLLEVDNRVVLPTGIPIRVLVTSSDVLHSWAIPSLGIKLDACPGRLNQLSLFLKREGTFYGQCSEICGINHAFMPIVVEGVSFSDYIRWLSKQ